MRDDEVTNSGEEEFIAEDDADQVRAGDDDGDVEGRTGDTLKKLRQDLKKCTAERGEYLAGWQRAKADFVNRERDVREGAERIANASRARLLEELLPILDGFDMATASPAWKNVDPSWRTGMEALKKQLESVLQNNGIEAFDPAGQRFDPAEHEAVETAPVDSEKEDHTVLAVHQKGYRLNGKVVRPARVKIALFSK